MIDYILKHQNKNVASFTLDKDGDVYFFDIIDSENMPILGSAPKNMAEWIQNRAIPDSRKDLEQTLREAGCETAQEYMIRNLALNLSDSYWICPTNEKEIKWEEINLYEHPTGILTFKNGFNEISQKEIKSDSSLGGSLEKYNLYEKDGWHLIKRGTPKISFGLQNINEAFASNLHERQGFQEYTRYTLNFDAYGECESCDCKYFTDKDHELISAYNVTGGITGRAETTKEAYKEYIDICVSNGLDRKYVCDFMDYMIMTDFLITNTDRHWENFGIIRDPNTLEFLSLAPIFDSGTSMMCDDPFTKNRLRLLKTDVHGICRSQQENLELVQNKNILDVSKLPTTKDVLNFYIQCDVQQERAEQIAGCYSLKKDMVLEFQHGLQICVQKEYEYNGNSPYKNGEINKEYIGKRNNILFVVMCGIPDSGKEVIAKEYIKDNPQTVYIRTNNIRKKIGLKIGEDESRVFSTAYSQIKQALKDGRDVVYVATNLDRETRNKALSLADGIDGVKKILSVIYKDPEQINTDIPIQKMKKMANILNDNKPDLSEGWDQIEVDGDRIKEHECQEHMFDDR